MVARLTVALLSAASGKVNVEIMVESYCPCSGAWESGFAEHMVPQIGEVVELRRFFDAKANGTQHCCNPSADDKAACMHGKTECTANALQRCVQAHYPQWMIWLNFTNCVNGPCDTRPDAFGCKYQFAVGQPKDLEREKSCAADMGLDWQAINACWTGDEASSLMQQDADRSDSMPEQYGITGLPVVWVAGRRVSKFWDCDVSKVDYQSNLLQAICDAAGSPKPAACSELII
jgi:hypothetical protein